MVTVLAGGWSAKPYLDRLPGLVIGVNDAALRVRCDMAVSMDRLWTEHRWEEIVATAKPAHIRRAALQNISARPDWLSVFECDHTSTKLSDTPGRLNGTHSGLCALNLAYQLRPERVVLAGFDMGKGPTGEAHWYPPYPWAPQGATSTGKFKAWASQFETAARQCSAAGVAVEIWGASAIPAFQRVA